ncbi:hypothetical protein A0J61_09774 [Choanephora cucurbitarum]|uniref:Uncharacterized protein n=1 Tax=Choanephora cucurbitarum TaxID=101091 RepID=A0A1C7MZC3_9FUNG|nr:hypothetical protein A0J61_09774 [Choanephora cucurbitarum]
MSLKVLSTALNIVLLAMDASSQMVSFAFFIKLPSSDLGSILHIDSVLISIGILKVEWDVRPPSNSRAAIPPEATAMAISRTLLVEFNKLLEKGFARAT